MDRDATDKTADSPSLGPMSERARMFLVVADGSPESDVAIRFAAGRAAHLKGGGVALFHAIPPGGFQHWMTVAERMREESLDDARTMLEGIAASVYAYSGVRPEIVIREGQPKEELLTFMDERDDLFALILGASTGDEPGPLVDYFSGPLLSRLKCPVVIVPGALTRDQIDAMV